MRKKQLLFIALLLFSFQFSFAQDDTEFKPRLVHAGINVTSVISSFSGNGSNIEAFDFPILFRFGKKKLVLRLGIGANGSSKESFDNITQSFRQSSSAEGAVRFGFEKNLVQEKKYNVYWGLDFIGRYTEDKVDIFNQVDSQIKDSAIGFGGGPLFGMKYHITNRLYLSSEATLYGIVNLETLEERGFTSSKINTTSYDFSLQPPLVLYLNYKL